MNSYRLRDLLDLDALQKMAAAHYRGAGMPIGIIDAIDDSILIGAGWQDICVKFHRANPRSRKRCEASDSYIKKRLVKNEVCHYKCKNGLWDIGIPIVVAGRHLATLFLGQFFYDGETPERDFFIRQAQEFGYNAEDYLAALDRVPVFNREKVGYILEYNKALVTFLTALAEHSLSKKTAEKALRESEEKLRTLVTSSSDAIIALDTQRRVTMCNPAFLTQFGYNHDEVIGKSIAFIHPREEDFHRLGNEVYPIVHGTGSWRGERTYVNKDGSTIILETVVSAQRQSDGAITGYTAVMRDLTERRQAEEERARLEAQLRQAQKMEAIGTLAGGIAHDFNNVLAAMVGYTELALDDIPKGSPARGSLEQVLESGVRAKNLVQQILSFSRQTEQERKAIQVGPVVEEAMKLLRATLPTTVEIEQEIETGPHWVLADPIQIHQLVMNLCTNAAHAMRERGGVLKIDLRRIDLDEESAAAYAELHPGAFERLSVTDTGEGMDRVTMERVFEPFFTTKKTGEGTGMGLAVVHGIVKSYGGAITVYSRPGEGSAFHVYLPLMEIQGEDVAPPETRPLPTGTERILLVDDEAALTEIGRQILERLGYRVTWRTSSLEALEAFKAGPDRFDLVITDQTMPKMTGVELTKELLKIRPDIPIVICTGFSAQISPQRAQELGVKSVLMKPVLARELAEAVRRVLDKE